MRSQCAIVLTVPLLVACESANVSHTSLPDDAPDLALRGVAFARLADGRVVARGTAEHLDYRRAGGRLVAFASAASIAPQGGTGLASFGTVYFENIRVEPYVGSETLRLGELPVLPAPK